MAQSYVDIVQRVESYYPAAIGGTAHDENLRQMLVPWANDVLLELNQMQRFSYDYGQTTFTTVAGTSTYVMPTGLMAVKRMFYIGPEGSPTQIDKRERFEAARVMGDDLGMHVGQPGAPRFWSLDNRQITLFPIPDANSPDAGGNYIIYVQGYSLLLPMVETTATVALNAITGSIPSTTYVLGQGVTVISPLAIRGAGEIQNATTSGTLLTPLITLLGTVPGVITFPIPAGTAVTNAQAFFNPSPWPVIYWPKVMLFAMLREVATYLHSQDSQMWSQRYMDELSLLRNYEMDRSRTIEFKIAAHAGQETAEESRIDEPVGMDIRGII